jgi:hypothetical protein
MLSLKNKYKYRYIKYIKIYDRCTNYQKHRLSKQNLVYYFNVCIISKKFFVQSVYFKLSQISLFPKFRF